MAAFKGNEHFHFTYHADGLQFESKELDFNYDSEDKNIVLINNEGFDSFVSALNQMHRIVDSN